MTRLLHLSDTHLHAPGAATLHPQIDTRARLLEVVDRVRAYGPFDAVVITGDVCDDGSEMGAEAVRESVDGLAPVILAVPGNHDLAEPVRDVFGEPRAELGPWVVVGVETQVEGEVAGVGDSLAPALAEIGDRPAVLLMHHPLESRSTHEWFTLGGRDAAVTAVEAHAAPLVVLSGHTHEPYAARCGTAHLLGAPATYYSIRHDGGSFEFVPAEYGTAVVTLDDETLEPSVELVMLTDDRMRVEDHIDLPSEGA
ncbi:MAG: metallophosphoesterase [Dermatophilaceae bacterium]|nr:metallophosphoesterase family protein [Intrasporangiaceae bacterium]